MNIVVGNAQDADTHGTGWFIGFSDWTIRADADLLHIPQDQALSGLCVKWYDHPTGHDSGEKPCSEGTTISMLVSDDSAFRIDFSESAGFTQGPVETVRLLRRGDFVAWGEGLFHRWHCESRSTILTIRWNSAPGSTARCPSQVPPPSDR